MECRNIYCEQDVGLGATKGYCSTTCRREASNHEPPIFARLLDSMLKRILWVILLIMLVLVMCTNQSKAQTIGEMTFKVVTCTKLDNSKVLVDIYIDNGEDDFVKLIARLMQKKECGVMSLRISNGRIENKDVKYIRYKDGNPVLVVLVLMDSGELSYAIVEHFASIGKGQKT